jgi:hypothetical protein
MVKFAVDVNAHAIFTHTATFGFPGSPIVIVAESFPEAHAFSFAASAASRLPKHFEILIQAPHGWPSAFVVTSSKNAMSVLVAFKDAF